MREFNLVLGSTIAVALVFLFISALFGEAIVDLVAEEDSQNGIRVPVWDRSNLPYETSGEFGIALETGEYEILATENEWNSTHHFVEYTLPIEEGGLHQTQRLASQCGDQMFLKASRFQLLLNSVLISRKRASKHQASKYPAHGLAR